MDKPQPRKKYTFATMKRGDVVNIRIPEDDPKAGVRARCAAYNYGMRNGKVFCGAVGLVRKKPVMMIRRVK